MADSASESDSSSVTDGPTMQPPSMPPSPITREQWQKRIDCLQQQNRVLRAELETYKLRVKSLHEENRALRQASVNIVSFRRMFLPSLRCHCQVLNVAVQEARPSANTLEGLMGEETPLERNIL